MIRVRPVAGALAITYWLGVAASYFWALANQDQFGFAFLPSFVMSFPWPRIADALASCLQPRRSQVVAFAAIVLLGSAVNAVLLYLLVVGITRASRARR
jgi:hypothetical protein